MSITIDFEGATPAGGVFVVVVDDGSPVRQIVRSSGETVTIDNVRLPCDLIVSEQYAAPDTVRDGWAAQQ